MSWETLITNVVSFVGILGGFEAIKFFVNRKSNKRINEAAADKKEIEADSSEFGLLKETVVFLQQQLLQKEERFSEQTALVRKQNLEIIDLTKQIGKIELELQNHRCVIPKCSNRKPQNGY